MLPIMLNRCSTTKLNPKLFCTTTKFGKISILRNQIITVTTTIPLLTMTTTTTHTTVLIVYKKGDNQFLQL